MASEGDSFETFQRALAADFAAHGGSAFAKARATRPHYYLRLIASGLAREESDPDAEEVPDQETRRTIMPGRRRHV